MTSITEFVKNIDTNNLITVLTKYFDQIVALYNIVGSRDDIDVIIKDSNGSTIQFGLLVETPEDANKLYMALNGTHFSTYGLTYVLQLSVTKNRVNAVFNRVQ